MSRFAKARLKARVAAIKSGQALPPVSMRLLKTELGMRLTGTLSPRYG